MLEASAGEDDDDRARNRMAEVNWSNASDTALLYLQFHRVDVAGTASTRRMSATQLGVRWLLTNRLTIAAQAGQRVQHDEERSKANEIRLHIRYRR